MRRYLPLILFTGLALGQDFNQKGYLRNLEASISLKVCLESDSPKLNDEDWEYIKSETRSEPAELIIGDINKSFDSFQVEENTIYFRVN